MNYLAYADVVSRLLRGVPELEPALSEHVRDYDEVLPHVFFGDVTRYVHAELERGRTDAVRRLLAVLELAVASPDQSTRDLVAASFLENLDSNPTAFSMLSTLAGPVMKLALTQEQTRRGLGPKTGTTAATAKGDRGK